MGVLLLGAAFAIGLVLIPLGLPGLWLMVAALLAYHLSAPGEIGFAVVLVAFALALVAEVLEMLLAGRYARKYGGSRRSGWGAILGGLVGAVVGVPVPVIGSMIGAFLGAFAGALLFELTRGTAAAPAARVATGALIGRAVAVAMKIGIGFMLAVWTVFAVVL